MKRETPFECFIFMGGKDGDRIYYSKPRYL